MEKGNNCSNFLRDFSYNSKHTYFGAKPESSNVHFCPGMTPNSVAVKTLNIFFISFKMKITLIVAWKFVSREFCNLKEQAMNFLWSHGPLELEGTDLSVCPMFPSYSWENRDPERWSDLIHQQSWVPWFSVKCFLCSTHSLLFILTDPGI